jgi:hypothetical protein
MKSLQRSALLALCAAFVCGCTTRPTVLDAQSRDDVGQVFVSVSSAAPLADYWRLLTPEFDLQPADALEIAVPVSQSSLFRAVDALRAGVAVNRTVAAAPTTPSAAVPSANGDGTPPGLTLGGFPADRQIGIDPVLRYQAAARLLAEVRMLNRSLRDVPFDPRTEQAHLVQFNVSVMPHHDSAPYDAYVDLTLVQPQSGVRLIPTLSNDSVELTQQQWAKNSVRAFNAATTSALGSIAAAVGINYTNNQLEELAGYSLNGITSVGSDGARTLRVRVAAQNQGRSGQRFLTARTHNIFVVVISKYDHDNRAADNKVTFCTRFDFRRVNGGIVPHQQQACGTPSDLVVQLPVDERSDFVAPAVTSAKSATPSMTLVALAADPNKPLEWSVVVPAWDARYLGDLRAVVTHGTNSVQVANMKPDQYGKALTVSFALPAPVCIAGNVETREPIKLIIERSQVRASPTVEFVAQVQLPQPPPTCAPLNTKAAPTETKVAQKPPPKAAMPESCAVTAQSFIRAEHIVIDDAGHGSLQALMSLSKGPVNKYTGKEPSIVEYLMVEGADAVSVSSGTVEDANLLKSRIGFKRSTRYTIALQNAVPNTPVIFDFARFVDNAFVRTQRCSVMPVRLRAPKPHHGP